MTVAAGATQPGPEPLIKTTIIVLIFLLYYILVIPKYFLSSNIFPLNT